MIVPVTCTGLPPGFETKPTKTCPQPVSTKQRTETSTSRTVAPEAKCSASSAGYRSVSYDSVSEFRPRLRCESLACARLDPQQEALSMGRLLVMMVLFSAVLQTDAQPPAPKYQPGTIMAVKAHEPGPSEKPSTRLFDITIRVTNTLFVVLYTQPAGTIDPEYRTGLNLLVLVGSKTLKFNDMLGHTREVPILSRKTIPETSDRSRHVSLITTSVTTLRG